MYIPYQGLGPPFAKILVMLTGSSKVVWEASCIKSTRSAVYQKSAIAQQPQCMAYIMMSTSSGYTHDDLLMSHSIYVISHNNFYYN